MSPSASILVVEDAPAMAIIIKAMLEKEYPVTLAHDAASAEAYLSENPVSLILCDIGLPDMNGMEFRKKLEAQREWQSIPFVFLTADERECVANQACALGVDDYLHKPIEKEKLLRTIRRSLQRNQQITHHIDQKLCDEATERLSPTLPRHIGTYKTDLLFKEASAGGGDMVLHIPRAHDDIIVIADVTGHGTKAKYFAHLYSGYLYGLMKHLDANAPLSALMQQLNQMIFRDDQLGMNLITCQMLSLRGNVVEICNAGHPMPMLLRHGFSAFIDSSGPMPGLMQHTEYPTTRITLGDDEQLLCYTDGLVEGNRDQDAQEAFRAWLLAEQAPLAMGTLWHAHQTCFNGALPDDVTAFTITCR